MANKYLKIKGEDLKGLQKVKEVLDEYKNHKCKVGVLGGNHPLDGTPYAEIGMKHEFGTQSKESFNYKGESITINGVPTRSWLRAPLKLKKSQISGKGFEGKMLVRNALIKDLENGYTGVGLKLLGINAESIIQEGFDTQGFGQWDRNISERYIELKGSDIPLIDSGSFRGSITSEVYKA